MQSLRTLQLSPPHKMCFSETILYTFILFFLLLWLVFSHDDGWVFVVVVYLALLCNEKKYCIHKEKRTTDSTQEREVLWRRNKKFSYQKIILKNVRLISLWRSFLSLFFYEFKQLQHLNRVSSVKESYNKNKSHCSLVRFIPINHPRVFFMVSLRFLYLISNGTFRLGFKLQITIQIIGVN